MVKTGFADEKHQVYLISQLKGINTLAGSTLNPYFPLITGVYYDD